ncbi:nucleotidyltransferase [Brevibacillus fluminis]|uniref:nucleotidyltransferase n=1 Tax=Brevibacillus fluminis TaxID=511487 RepID=UPI003F8C9866
MKTVGLVVEYNPLHNGHYYHYTEAKRVTGADACAIVMSGNFLQRGEPALLSKWARAEMALQAGIDLVIELPLPFSCATAELFALGAVSVLDRIGVVDSLCFGSESGEIGWISELAELLAEEPEAFSRSLKAHLGEGLSYPTAYARAASELLGHNGSPEADLASPNNILGLNYLLALKRLGSRIQPATIKRQKAGYHQTTITDAQIASATAIRKLIFGDDAGFDELAPYVPPTTLAIMQREFALGRGPINWERFRHPLFHRLLQLSPEEIAGYHEVGEGIEHRLKAAARQAGTVAELVAATKNKRYTWNRIQRMLTAVLLDMKKSTMAELSLKNGAPYARILGFSKVGKQLLHEAKKKSSIPLITKVTDGLHPMLDMEIAAAAVYSLAQPEPGDRPFTAEYRRPPIVLA